jgi:hypothetical protein
MSMWFPGSRQGAVQSSNCNSLYQATWLEEGAGRGQVCTDALEGESHHDTPVGALSD